MARKEKVVDTMTRKRYLSYFLLFFPSLILVAIPVTGNFLSDFALKLLVIFYQFVVIKNFVDNYYGE